MSSFADLDSLDTCSEGGSGTFLRAIDEEYETADGVKGGDLKKDFLLGRDRFKFDRRPQLDALIRDLTDAFAARYEELLTADQFDALKQMQSSNVPSFFLGENITFKYQKRLNDLVSPSWLVDTFQRSLDTDPWPPSDKARGQPIISTLSDRFISICISSASVPPLIHSQLPA